MAKRRFPPSTEFTDDQRDLLLAKLHHANERLARAEMDRRTAQTQREIDDGVKKFLQRRVEELEGELVSAAEEKAALEADVAALKRAAGVSAANEKVLVAEIERLRRGM